MLTNKYSTIILLLLATLISCFAAFVNGYPLVYEDTGAYIHSGFSGEVLDDRPIFYGLFLRHISLSSSLWYVIFVQGFIISYLLFLSLGIFFEGDKRKFIFIFLITFLVLTTGFSYNVSILIPDIFTSVSLLCLINLLIHQNLNKRQKILLSVLFIVSVCTQFSSILVIGFLLLALLVFYWLRKMKRKETGFAIKQLVLVISLFLLSLVMLPTTHFLYGKKFQISGSNHVFLMNHFVETGILEEYLKDACNTHQYKICEYKDALGWNFIWSPESPLQKTGGWASNKLEYNEIIQDILTTPKYLKLTLQKGFESSLKQFFAFNVSISAPQLSKTPTYTQVHWHYYEWLREYSESQQNQKKTDVYFLNNLQPWIILISLVLIISVLIIPFLATGINFNLKSFLLIVLLHNIANAVICSNLSTVHPRFQNRLAWLFPFMAAIIIFKYLETKKQNNKPL